MKPPCVLSQTVEYALRATLCVAQRAPHPVRISEIAAQIQAPRGYLAKILGQLAREGILESARGRTGGFRLAPQGDDVTLATIISVFAEDGGRRCLLGHGICGQNPDCTVHHKWAPIAQTSADFFAQTTVAELLSSNPLA